MKIAKTLYKQIGRLIFLLVFLANGVAIAHDEDQHKLELYKQYEHLMAIDNSSSFMNYEDFVNKAELNKGDYVWVSSLENRLWTRKYGLVRGISRGIMVYLRAFNPSYENAKIRIQGLAGNQILFEHDVTVPAGQSQPLVGAGFPIHRYYGNQTLPNIIILSSDKKIVPNGIALTERYSYQIVGENNFFTSPQAVGYGAAGHNNIDFTILDCDDYANNGLACISSIRNHGWNTFLPPVEDKAQVALPSQIALPNIQ